MLVQKNILFLSLGSEPAVFRSTMQCFAREYPSVVFDRVVTFCNTNLRKNQSKRDLNNAIKDTDYPETNIKKLFSNCDDLISKENNLDFFKLVFDALERAKKENYKIYVNIAGGRKQMSALLLAAAYISGVDKIFHTIWDPPGKNSKVEKTALIEIPHLHLDKLLERIVSEIDRENRFKGSVASLVKQLQTEGAFTLLNKYLDDQGRYRKLKEEFSRNVNKYDLMLQASEMIIRNILNGNLMFPPQFEKRTKDFESFYKKILRKEQSESEITDPFARFSDFAGLRIIFYNTSDLDKAVKLIENSGDFVNFREGEKLKSDDKSKEFGYRAVHLDVKLEPRRRCRLLEYKNLKDIPCEIQLTTVFAHAWSKVHHALSYKDNREMPLTEGEREELDIAFREAAKNLKRVEDEITRLSNVFSSKNPKKEKVR